MLLHAVGFKLRLRLSYKHQEAMKTERDGYMAGISAVVALNGGQEGSS